MWTKWKNQAIEMWIKQKNLEVENVDGNLEDLKTQFKLKHEKFKMWIKQQKV